MQTKHADKWLFKSFNENKELNYNGQDAAIVPQTKGNNNGQHDNTTTYNIKCEQLINKNVCAALAPFTRSKVLCSIPTMKSSI